MVALDDVGTYPDAEIMDALLANGREVRFRFELLDSNRNPIRYLDSVQSGARIEYNYLAEVKRTCTLTIDDTLEDEGSIDYLSNLIKPYMGLRMPDGLWTHISLGVFMMSSPSVRSVDGRKLREIQGYDLGHVLRQNFTEDRLVIAAGSVITDEVVSILDSLNLANVIDASPATLAGDKDWDPGTSYAVVVNDLLDIAGYASIFFDEEGVARVRPWLPLDARKIVVVYATDQFSVVQEDATLTEDLFNLPNKWTLVANQVDSDTVLTATYTNDDPESSTSTVRRGFTITDWRSEEDTSDQDSLNAKVLRIAQEASQVFGEVEFTTALMPVHGENTVLTLQHDPLGVTDDYSEITWSMELTPGGAMNHTARRTVVLNGTIT